MDRLVALALLAVVVGASLLGTALVGPPGLNSTVTVTQTVTSTNLETRTSEVTRTATQSNFPCKGRAKCWQGTVTKIIDGDTLEIDSTRVRLALVDAPESGQPGFSESLEFVKRLCPVGSEAVIDQDDKQLTDKFGRTLGVVWCSGKNVNAELLYAGLGRIDTRYCMQSEFRGEEIWLLTISSSQSDEGGFSFGILRVEMSRQQDTASDDMLALEFDDPHKS